MRYYLDTNILFFLIFNPSELDADVKALTTDFSNLFYTSSVCVMELVQLLVRYNETVKKPVDTSEIVYLLDKYNIEIKYISEQHIMYYAAMPVLHSDPNDRLIIAHAIVDRAVLISSDKQFPQYQKRLKGFNFILNKR